MTALHVDVVCRTKGPGAVDGIRDHAVMLAAALGTIDGVTAAAQDLRRLDAGRDLVRLASGGNHASHAIVVQYNPFSYGRWGWAPWLVRELRRLRAQRRTVVVLLVHELFVELDGPRDAVIGLLQRAQFFALRALSDVVLATTEPIAERAGGVRGTPAGVLPVGSNLPDRRAARDGTRRALGIERDQQVVGLFGTGHWGRMFDLTARTLDHLAEGRRLVVLNLGAGAPPLPTERANLRVHTPGELDVDRLAEYLSATDVLLLPFVDGASTRRTTLMAGLQHAIPIVTTLGRNTGALLRDSDAIVLIPVDEVHQSFAARAEALLDDGQLRARMSNAGRALHDEHFAWPVIARRLHRHIRAPPERL